MKVIFCVLAALTVIIATAATTATIIQCKCPNCGYRFNVSTTAVQEQTPEQRSRDKAEAEKATVERQKIQKDSIQDTIDKFTSDAENAHVECKKCGKDMVYRGSSQRTASSLLIITHKYRCQCGETTETRNSFRPPRIRD